MAVVTSFWTQPLSVPAIGGVYEEEADSRRYRSCRLLFLASLNPINEWRVPQQASRTPRAGGTSLLLAHKLRGGLLKLRGPHNAHKQHALIGPNQISERQRDKAVKLI